MGSTKKTLEEMDVMDDFLANAMVEQVKKKPEVRLAYMRFDEVLYWEKKESHEQGQEEAYHSMIISFLQVHGALSEELRDKIENITDVSLLEKLVKLAAKTDQIGDFEYILETQSFDPDIIPYHNRK